MKVTKTQSTNPAYFRPTACVSDVTSKARLCGKLFKIGLRHEWSAQTGNPQKYLFSYKMIFVQALPVPDIAVGCSQFNDRPGGAERNSLTKFHSYMLRSLL